MTVNDAAAALAAEHLELMPAYSLKYFLTKYLLKDNARLFKCKLDALMQLFNCKLSTLMENTTRKASFGAITFTIEFQRPASRAHPHMG